MFSGKFFLLIAMLLLYSLPYIALCAGAGLLAVGFSAQKLSPKRKTLMKICGGAMLTVFLTLQLLKI